MNLLNLISQISNVRIKREKVLKEIQNNLGFFDFDVMKQAVLSKKNLDSSISYFIQLSAKIAIYQPIFREKIVSFIKDYYKNNWEKFDTFRYESILFFFFIIERTYLLNIDMPTKELTALKSRFLFVDEELGRKFLVPINDSLNEKRLLNFDNLLDNIIGSGEVKQFQKMLDFVNFTCKFPFINDISFIANWAGIKDIHFLNLIINSRLFIHDNKNIIFSPFERIKAEKFVIDKAFRKTFEDKIINRQNEKKRKEVFLRFIDNFMTMVNIFADRGICFVGYNGIIRCNDYVKNVLGLNKSSDKYIKTLVYNFAQNKKLTDKFIINGFQIETVVSEFISEGFNIGYMVILRDITEEEILKKFSAHDIKNSIISIENSFNLLDLSSNLDDEEMQYIESSKKAVNNLKTKFNDFFSLRSKTLSIDNNVDVNSILQRCMIVFNSSLSIKNMEIKFLNLEDEIFIDCDEHKIYRVFENIISNAIKYSPKNTVITIETKIIENFVSIDIKDQGDGIDEGLGDNIFHVGKRLENSKNVEGSGIGLGVVKKFVIMHHGRISYKRNNDMGTTFTIQLPKR